MNTQTRIVIDKFKKKVIITKHEKKVCRLLRELNISYHPQYPIEMGKTFILVDILIPKTKVIIEVDGKHHYKGQKLLDDALRDKFLKEIGFRVIRIENDEVRVMTKEILLETLK